MVQPGFRRPIIESHQAVGRWNSSFARLPEHGIGADGHRDIEPMPDLHAEKSGRSHADHRKQPAIEPDRALGHRGIAAELALPERVADHRARRSASGLIVLRAKYPAHDGGYLQDVEESPLTNRPSAYRALPSCARLNLSRSRRSFPKTPAAARRTLSHKLEVKFALRVDHQPDRWEPFTKSR